MAAVAVVGGVRWSLMVAVTDVMEMVVGSSVGWDTYGDYSSGTVAAGIRLWLHCGGKRFVSELGRLGAGFMVNGFRSVKFK